MQRKSQNRYQGPKRAAIYCRVSTAGQEEDGTSLQTQEERCRQFAEARGYTVLNVYRDVHTGMEWKERPALTTLRQAIRTDVDVVVCYAIDRLSRHQAHLAILADEVEEYGARLEFVTEDFEDSAVGRFIRSAKAFAAEVEREKIVERSVRGKLARVRSGKLMPGCRPRYGFQWNDDRTGYVANPATAPVVQGLFTGILQGRTERSLARELTTSGTPTPKGGTIWSHCTVHQILTDRVYTGQATGWRYTTAKTRTTSQEPTKRHLRPQDEWIPLPAGVVESLIDQATFEATQQRLRLNRERAARNNRTPDVSLLRGGYARCGYCDRALRVRNKSGGRGAEYVCQSRIDDPDGCMPTMAVHLLDALVWERLERTLTQPEVITAELERMQDYDPASDDLEAIERSLTNVARQQRNLIENLANVSGTAASLITDKINALEKQREDLTQERAAVLARAEAHQRAQARLSDVHAWCSTVAANLTTLSYDEKRLALDALGVRVQVWKTDHTPRWKVSASIPLDAPAEPSIVFTTPIPSSSTPRS